MNNIINKTKIKVKPIAANSKETEKPMKGEIVTFSAFEKLGMVRKAVNEAQREYLRKTLFPTLSDQEVLLVLYKAHNLKLDILNQEMTAYKTSKGQLVTIVGKDAKLRLANNTGVVEYIKGEAIYRKKIEKTAGVDETGKPNKEITYQLCQAWEGGELWGAWAELKRIDETQPHRVQVALKEYNQGNTMWNNKPETMIKKVARSQVVTEAFPELFAGVYEEEEMPTINSNGMVERELPKLAYGNAPADEAQLQTIKALSGNVDLPESITKQEAAQMIKELSMKKGGKQS
jgi:phage recombination protein Bet